MIYADWWVGSSRIDDQTINVDGGAEVVAVPREAIYLWNPVADLSLFAQLEIALAAGGVVNPRVFFTTSRRVRIEADAAFEILWGAGLELRDLLGFTSDITGFAGYTAAELSPLLWSPGKRMSPQLAPLNFNGQPVADIAAQLGPRGVQTVREQGQPTVIQRFELSHVERARYREVIPGPAPGEFAYFWQQIMLLSLKMIVLREVLEGTSDTEQPDYESGVVLGPYVYDLTGANARRLPFARSLGFERCETFYSLTIPVIVTPEYV